MIDPAEVLRAWSQGTPEATRLAEVFASPAAAGRRYVLGRNEHSVALAQAIEIDAFVDDFAEPGSLWHAKPVIKGSAVPAHGLVVNCSMSISPVSAAKRLTGLHVSGVLALSDLCRRFPGRIPLPAFVAATRQDLAEHPGQWQRLSDALADARSREVLDDVLRYRLTGDYSAMEAYSVRLRDQYFEDILGLGPGEVFVDAGGFDGDTTEEFARRCPGYRKVFLFEPSTTNIQKARARLAGQRGIEFIESGLSDVEGTLCFNPDAGSASAVSDSGAFRIHVTTLDDRVRERVSLVKMDLEGWELKALEGSRRHILEDHPKLAIAVYHHPSDFWRVFDFVTAVRADYQVHLRHYTEGWSETVMYFTPVGSPP